ncbi:MAG: HlyC/CorC family transporter [Actinomycetia bacterium]|nr:HlyC/CorC family transporter [Actinomycetes bacterium]MCP4087523.1 HlyC/CorC family transporter [Actinomycetes bacterium]
MSTTLAVLGILLALVVVILAALAETGLIRLGRARAEAVDDPERVAVLTRMLDARERLLPVIVLVGAVAQVVLVGLPAVYADRRWGTGGLVIAMAIEVLVISVAVALPRGWAFARPERAVERSAPLAAAITRVAPLRWAAAALDGLTGRLFSGSEPTIAVVSEEELLALAGQAAAQEVIEAEERELIESVFDFGDTTVREVMVPRPDMVTINTSFRVSDAMEVAVLNGFSRLPVAGEGVDDLRGVVFAKDLMRAELDDGGDTLVLDLLRPAHFVPETKRIAELLPEMQAQTFHLALVIDEYGGTAGLVTLEDIIEELVGEIVDEFDVEEPLAQRLAGGDLRVNARIPVDEVNDLLATNLPSGDWNTVGGLIVTELGHVPVVGETVEVAGYHLTVERVQGRRIARVRITAVPVVDETGSSR